MSRWASRSMFAAREARRLAEAHYSEPHTEPHDGCGECASIAATFTLTLSAYWQPRYAIPRGFTRGATTGICAPRHGAGLIEVRDGQKEFS